MPTDLARRLHSLPLGLEHDMCKSHRVAVQRIDCGGGLYAIGVWNLMLITSSLGRRLRSGMNVVASDHFVDGLHRRSSLLREAWIELTYGGRVCHER